MDTLQPIRGRLTQLNANAYYLLAVLFCTTSWVWHIPRVLPRP